jgi:chlorophyll synthase
LAIFPNISSNREKGEKDFAVSNISPNNAKSSAEPTQLERLASASGIRNMRRTEHSASFAETLLSFLKPITWIPVIWSFVCGAVASGKFGWANLGDGIFWLGVFLTGPLATGTCQMLNDYFDREIDAINEPTRPIPSGAISLRNATILISVWSVFTVLIAWLIHPFVLAHVILGIVNAHLYSANPIKLKKRLWWGNIIVAFSYLMYPWLSGEVAYRGEITIHSVVIAFCYAFASTGTMTVNDFKSIEGDIRVGIRTLPVVFGERKAAMIAALLIDVGQVFASLYLLLLGQYVNALLAFLFIFPQIALQVRFVSAPRKYDVWYNGIAQNFLVAGMMVCALAIANV